MFKPKSLYDIDDEEVLQKSLYDIDEEIPQKKKIKIYLKKHPCFGMNSKGESCKCVGTKQYTLENWYCWRHFDDAGDFEKVHKKNNILSYIKKINIESGFEEHKKKIFSSEIWLKLLLELEKL